MSKDIINKVKNQMVHWVMFSQCTWHKNYSSWIYKEHLQTGKRWFVKKYIHIY